MKAQLAKILTIKTSERLTCVYNVRSVCPSRLKRWQGVDTIRHLAVESIPPDFDADGFYLSMPDFNCQNTFIDDNGAITALIDWDGVCAGRAVFGYARYPSWITRDWDPAMRYWGFEDYADSPEQLFRYRQAYADALCAAVPPGTPEVVRLSALMEAITLMVTADLSSDGIMQQLFNWAFQNDPPFSSYQELLGAYENDRAGPWEEAIRVAF